MQGQPHIKFTIVFQWLWVSLKASSYVLTTKFQQNQYTLPANTSKRNLPIRYTAITIKQRQRTKDKHNTNEILLLIKKEVLKNQFRQDVLIVTWIK